MPLSDRSIINLKPSDKLEKHFDSGGLHLVVTPAGGKQWRYAYRFQGKQKLLSIGPYPAISLKAARERRDEARGMLNEGVDPAEHKQAMKKFSVDRAENSFMAVAKEWHLKYRAPGRKITPRICGIGLIKMFLRIWEICPLPQSSCLSY